MGDLITYEELFDILRKERTDPELQQLDAGFYSSLVKYFREKQSVLKDDSEEASIFGSERQGIAVQLENAKKIAKEIIERREKKILNLALNKARTESDIMDSTSILEPEKALFYSSLSLFSKYKEGVLGRILELQEPKFEVSEPGLASGHVSAADDAPESLEHSEQEPVDSGQIEEDSEERKTGVEDLGGPLPENSVQETKVVFTASVPRFLGRNGEVYGPYEEGQSAMLSSDIAGILVSKGRAEESEK